MPYVKGQVRKSELDAGALPTSEGELTFLITRQIQKYLTHITNTTGGYRYAHLDHCLGALTGAEVDFVRRIVTPYEEFAQAVNGDVWPKRLLMGEGEEGEQPLPPLPLPYP